jgi:hypothetical protein
MFKLYDQPFPDGDYRYLQIAFVVPDVVRAAWDWVDLHGAGPFLLLMPPAEFDAPYRGGTAHLHYRLGVTQLGPLQIELIEVLDDTPDYYRDMFGPGEGGPHHISTFTSDFDAAIAHYAGRGLPPVSTSTSPVGRVAYIDTRSETGLYTEVLERTELMLDGLRSTARLCAQWDGTNPVRVKVPGQGWQPVPRPTSS